MKNIFIPVTKYSLFAALIMVAVACGKKEDNSLAGKKAKLAELQKSQSALSAEIKTLESEIHKLDPNKAEKVKNVSASPLLAKNFLHYVEATGRVDAENNMLVSPQIGGAITQLFVKEGDFVSKGQKVATIDNTVLRNSIQEIQIQLETAKTLYERQKALWDQKIGTEIQFIQAKTQVESLERRIATLKSQDAMNVVLSPIAGYVDEVRLRAGDMAAPGLGIVRVVNFSNLKVVANVPDTYAGSISKGDIVKIKFPDLQKEVNATLSFVSQTVNQVSRTFLVEARIQNFDKQLKPNLTAILNINDQTRASSIVIPQNYIQNTELGSVVFIAVTEGNKKIARSREVKTGLSYNGEVEIISGLSSGDLVITDGYQDLVDGQLISY